MLALYLKASGISFRRTRSLCFLFVAAASGLTPFAALARPRPPLPVAPRAFETCAACHSVTKDGANGMGPNLRGVVGRKIGTAPGFGYSPAMKRSAMIWTPTSLDQFLAAPASKIPNNAMPFPGLNSSVDRKMVVKYLESLR